MTFKGIKNKGIIVGLNNIIRIFSKESPYSYQIQRTVLRTTILDFFSNLQPQSFGMELIRIGSKSDGGYLLPKDLEGVKKCISPGVGNSINFEKILASEYSIVSFLADPTVSTPDFLPTGVNFKNIGISYSSEPTQITDMESGERKEFNSVALGEFINEHASETENELILQMDIENAEYLTLLATAPKILRKFRIMIIEFHSLPKIFDEKYYTEIIKPLFDKLNQIFYVAHIHANNVAKPVKILNYEIPHAIEVTFHNRNRVNTTRGTYITEIYNELDKPCDPTKPEVHLNMKLFSKNSNEN